MAQTTIQIADKPTLNETLSNTQSIIESASEIKDKVSILDELRSNVDSINEQLPTLADKENSDQVHGIVTDIIERFSGGGISNLPYEFMGGSAVTLNNEIHILGGYASGTETNHYKWDGVSWTSVSTLPYNFNFGCAVVLDNEIHILGSSDVDCRYNHYKWDGVSWTSVSTLPYEFEKGSAVVLNGEIHILGGAETTLVNEYNHYKWDGVWTSVSVIGYEASGVLNGCATVLNGEIYCVGGMYADQSEKCIKWNGTSWEFVVGTLFCGRNGSLIASKNEIHYLGGNYNTDSESTIHYKFNGGSFVRLPDLPYKFRGGSATVLNGEIHILGSENEDYSKCHYVLNRTIDLFNQLHAEIKDLKEAVAKIPTAYPNVSSGIASTTETTITGKGKITFWTTYSSGNIDEICSLSIDGTTISNPEFIIRSATSSYNKFAQFTFEESISFTANVGTYIYYMVQLAD